MQSQRIIVIGSTDHQRVDYVDWLEPFPNLEEYDSVIINMPSLGQETYDKIEDKIKNIQESISTIIDTGRQIFCIISDKLSPSPPPILPGEVRYKSIIFSYVSPTNYD